MIINVVFIMICKWNGVGEENFKMYKDGDKEERRGEYFIYLVFFIELIFFRFLCMLFIVDEKIEN